MLRQMALLGAGRTAAAMPPDTTAPTIISANSANCAENSTLSHSLTANEAVTWSIVGGADQARFEISGSTLRWAGNGTKDYETPNDADTNNTYVVQVRATDGASNTTNQTITITVTDVGEASASNALTDTARAGNGTVATFTNKAIGSASATRIVLVGILGEYSQVAVSGVTIGGVAASKIAGASGNSALGIALEVWALAVSAGTTATIEVTWASAQITGIRVYALDGVNATPTGSDIDFQFTAARANAVTVPAGGFAITFAAAQNEGVAGVFTNCVEDGAAVFVESGSNTPFQSAHNVTAGAQSPTFGTFGAGSDVLAIASVAYGP